MAFAIGRISKQKGGSVGSSSGHNDRKRETPNADPKRAKENRVLIGDGRSVPEAVKQVIDDHGGKPRSDSVEAVEALLTASPEWFMDDDESIDRKKVDQFCQKAIEFLLERKHGGICVRATLHMDEKTPHIHAHMVPIDPNGKLNCKHYFGGRQKLREWQNAFAKKMEPLGLERGVKDSRARHQDVKDFYKAITRDHRIRVDPLKVPDPPRMLLTKDAAQKYKEELIRAVIKEVKEPIRTQLDQAKLTRDETAKRVEIEKRAGEQITAWKARAKELFQQRDEQVRLNDGLEQRNLQLQGSNENIKQQLRAEIGKRSEYELLAHQLSERTRDIPLHEVMDRMNYPGELIGQTHVYRGDDGAVTLLINNNVMRDAEENVLARNSLELVMCMHNEFQGLSINHMDALSYLADNFGETRAGGAFRAGSEQALGDYYEDRSQRREQEREISQQRPGQEREQAFERYNTTQDGMEHDHIGGPDHSALDHDIGFGR